MHGAFIELYRKLLKRAPSLDMTEFFFEILAKKDDFFEFDASLLEDELVLMTLEELFSHEQGYPLKLKADWKDVKKLLTILNLNRVTVKINENVADFSEGMVLIRVSDIDPTKLIEELESLYPTFIVTFKHFTFVPLPLDICFFKSLDTFNIRYGYIYIYNAIGHMTNLEEYKEWEEQSKSASYSVTRTVLRFLVDLEEKVLYKGILFPRRLLNHPERDYVYKTLCQLG